TPPDCTREFEFRFDSVEAAGATLENAIRGGQTHLFQGLWTDPVTGISYARARWYDPRHATWLQQDPAGAIDSANLYAFVGWGPHSNIDPQGMYIESAIDIASLTMGYNSLLDNIANDAGAGAIAVDLLGMALDGVAVALPLAPGGAGAAIRSSRLFKRGIRTLEMIDTGIGIVQGVGAAAKAQIDGNFLSSMFSGGMSAIGLKSLARNLGDAIPRTKMRAASTKNVSVRTKTPDSVTASPGRHGRAQKAEIASQHRADQIGGCFLAGTKVLTDGGL
ncbi:MAG: hypothetical protein GY835_16185, partial [bacterium]|nr:hypothetical protein [bacterium]